MVETFLNPIIKRLADVETLIESNKQKVLLKLRELAKNDHDIPKELEEQMNKLT